MKSPRATVRQLAQAGQDQRANAAPTAASSYKPFFELTHTLILPYHNQPHDFAYDQTLSPCLLTIDHFIISASCPIYKSGLDPPASRMKRTKCDHKVVEKRDENGTGCAGR
jgi:hypothetical protein